MDVAGNVFIVVAPSGAGKTTLVSALLASDNLVRLAVSYTTRLPRAGEVQGVDYYFISRDQFIAMAERGEFLEYAEVYGQLYGTTHAEIASQTRAGHDLLLEMDGQGAQQASRHFKQAIRIFILPPSIAVLEERLRGRAKDGEATIRVRLDAARTEIRQLEAYDYVIINEFIDAAVRDMTSIVRAARLSVSAQWERCQPLVSALEEERVAAS